MGYLPPEFEAEPVDPEDLPEEVSPATVLESPGGALFVVVGTGPAGYVGCLVRPDRTVEGYYRVPGADKGLTEALEPLHAKGWE